MISKSDIKAIKIYIFSLFCMPNAKEDGTTVIFYHFFSIMAINILNYVEKINFLC